MWFFFQKSHHIGHNARYLCVIAVSRDTTTVSIYTSPIVIFSMVHDHREKRLDSLTKWNLIVHSVEVYLSRWLECIFSLLLALFSLGYALFLRWFGEKISCWGIEETNFWLLQSYVDHSVKCGNNCNYGNDTIIRYCEWCYYLNTKHWPIV